MRFFGKREDEQNNHTQVNIIGDDTFNFRILKMINQLDEAPDDGTTLHENVLAFNRKDYNGLTSDIKNCIQDYDLNEAGSAEKVILSIGENILNQLSNEKEYYENNITANEELKIIPLTIKDNNLYYYSLSVVKFTIVWNLCALSLVTFSPTGLTLHLLRSMCATYFMHAYVELGIGSYYALGYDTHSLKIEKCDNVIQESENKLKNTSNSMEHFERIKALIKTTDEIKNNKIENPRNCLAYKILMAKNKNSSNLLDLFALCKHHIEVYNFYNRKFQGDNTPNFLIYARSELVKCAKILSKESNNILNATSIDTETKLLFLVDVLKMHDQYNRSFLGSQHEWTNEQLVMEGHVIEIINSAKEILSYISPCKKIQAYNQLKESETEYFEKLLELLETYELKSISIDMKENRIAATSGNDTCTIL